MMFLVVMTMSFILTNHPLTMGLALMVTSLTMGVILALQSQTAWVAYMLIMIFVSGMMIIILYMASLSSNEVVSPSPSFLNTYFVLLFFALLFSMLSSWYNNFVSWHYNFFAQPLFNIIYKTYTQLMNPMTTLVIFYLLVVLIVAVNIVSISKLPLRSKG